MFYVCFETISSIIFLKEEKILMNPLDKIQSYFENFTKTEQEIAIYIINHPLETARKDINTIAKNTHSSKSALIRFSQKMGYSGFSEFRFDLSRSLVTVNGQETPEEQKPQIHAIADVYCQYIQQIKTSVLPEEMEQLAGKIASSNRIKIFGIDRTYTSALQLRLRIAKIGYDAEAVDNTALMIDFPEILNKDDLIIIFTIRDNHKEYAPIVAEASSAGIPVICITMTPNLKFKKHCDQYICLPCISKEMDYSFLDNQAIFLVFIEMILGSLATIPQK